MKLNLEKNIKIAVEVNNEKFVSTEDGILYQYIDDNEIFLCIKSNKDDGKEIKIRVIKDNKDDNN